MVLATQVYEASQPVGRRIVLIGGGLVGCEIGLHLAQNGHGVTVIEMRDSVAADAPMDYRRFLMEKVDACVSTACGLTVVGDPARGGEGQRPGGQAPHLPADTVVLAAGFRARQDVVALPVFFRLRLCRHRRRRRAAGSSTRCGRGMTPPPLCGEPKSIVWLIAYKTQNTRQKNRTRHTPGPVFI